MSEERPDTGALALELHKTWAWDIGAFAESVIPWGDPDTPYGDWVRPYSWCVAVFRDFNDMLRERHAAAPDDRKGALGQIGVLMSSGVGTSKSSFMLPVFIAWILATRSYSRGGVTAPTDHMLQTRLWVHVKALFEHCELLLQ